MRVHGSRDSRNALIYIHKFAMREKGVGAFIIVNQGSAITLERTTLYTLLHNTTFKGSNNNNNINKIYDGVISVKIIIKKRTERTLNVSKRPSSSL